MFFRQPEIGRLGLDYARAESEYCDVFGGNTGPKPDFQTDQYSLSAEYYLSAVTLGLTRSQSRLRNDFGADKVSDSAFARAAWYADPNLKLGLSAGRLDAKETYAAFAEYQPSLLGRKVSLSLRYSEQQDVDAHTTTLTLSYSFDQGVDLKARDRRLR